RAKLVAAQKNRKGTGRYDQVAIIQRHALVVIDRVVDARRLQAQHGNRPTLDHFDLRAMAVKVLRNVVSAVPDAQYEYFFVTPRCATAESVRMHDLTLEILQARCIGQLGLADNPVGKHQVPGAEDTFSAVGAAHPRAPLALLLVVAPTQESRSRPHI